MSKISHSQMVEVHGLQCVERGGEFWFPGAEIGRLLGYSDPVRAISKVFHRHVQHLQEHTGLVTVTTPGGNQEVRVFDEEATYFLVMRSDTERASEICMQFASALKELRQRKLQELQSQVRALACETRYRVEAALGMTPMERERIPKVLNYLRRGFSTREIALVMQVHRRTVQGYITRIRQLGLLEEAAQ